jgi:hypothetical protein
MDVYVDSDSTPTPQGESEIVHIEFTCPATGLRGPAGVDLDRR